MALEKQNYHANMGNLLKDDLIKEMRKGLKQTTLEVETDICKIFSVNLQFSTFVEDSSSFTHVPTLQV